MSLIEKKNWKYIYFLFYMLKILDVENLGTPKLVCLKCPSQK